MAYVNISYFKVYRSVYFAVIPEICEMSKGILVYSEEGFRDVTDGEIRNNLLCTKCINIVSIFQYCLHQFNSYICLITGQICHRLFTKRSLTIIVQ